MHVSADLSQWRVSEINEADVTGFSQIRSTANSLLDNRITTAELVTQITCIYPYCTNACVCDRLRPTDHVSNRLHSSVIRYEMLF